LHYAASTDKAWVINQLGIERYVAGVAEAGNDYLPEYLKSLYTAVRSYVYSHYLHPTKHAPEHYLVDATANDQVYRGRGFTMRAPNVLAAAQATTGQIVMYNNEPVVTPYFSESDGTTRAWADVWYGEKAYLQAVPDPCCTGKPLLGHGVGMSATGARYFAETEGWTAEQILQYYYQGIAIEQVW
jgi:stage II sporulation protein D